MRQRSKWAVPVPKTRCRVLQLCGLAKVDEVMIFMPSFCDGRTIALRLAPLSFFARISFHGGWQVEDELS